MTYLKASLFHPAHAVDIMNFLVANNSDGDFSTFSFTQVLDEILSDGLDLLFDEEKVRSHLVDIGEGEGNDEVFSIFGEEPPKNIEEEILEKKEEMKMRLKRCLMKWYVELKPIQNMIKERYRQANARGGAFAIDYWRISAPCYSDLKPLAGTLPFILHFQF